MPTTRKRHMQLEPVVGVTEAMTRLGVSRQTVIREIQSKNLQAMRVGRQYRIREDELGRYEKAARRAA